jgi:hypothetical protein
VLGINQVLPATVLNVEVRCAIDARRPRSERQDNPAWCSGGRSRTVKD